MTNDVKVTTPHTSSLEAMSAHPMNLARNKATHGLETLALNSAHANTIGKALAKTGMIPFRYQNKPDDLAAAILMGSEMGLNVFQSLQQIYVIKGTPAIQTEGLLAMVMASGLWEGADERYITKEGSNDVIGCEVTVYRKGVTKNVTRKFTLSMAKDQGLEGPSWAKMPARMLYKRALSRALRDGFPDVLNGAPPSVEEVEDGISSGYIGAEPVKKPQNATDRILADFNMEEIILDDATPSSANSSSASSAEAEETDAA